MSQEVEHAVKTAANMPVDEALGAARELGRLDGAAFDARLERAEAKAREKRLTELAWSPRAEHQMWGSREAVHKVLQLEARVQELGHYVKAVQTSTPWRIIQWLRSLVGREW